MSRIRSSMTAVVLLSLCFSGSAHAQLVNGSFETGDFTGWTTIGNATVVGNVGSIPPQQGTFQAMLSTGGATASPGAIETFLGIPAGSLNTLIGLTCTEGSAFKQSITVTAGQQLTVNLNFLTNEFTPDPLFNDFMFFCVVGPGATLVKTADTFNPVFTPATGTGFAEQTDYKTYTHTFTASGTVTVGYGLMDVTDTIVNSALLLDGIGAPAPPPPPPPPPPPGPTPTPNAMPEGCFNNGGGPPSIEGSFGFGGRSFGRIAPVAPGRYPVLRGPAFADATGIVFNVSYRNRGSSGGPAAESQGDSTVPLGLALLAGVVVSAAGAVLLTRLS